MRLVFEAGMRAFPPRLASQPIFYPVLNEVYAAQIARDWNTREEPFAGYVLRFEVPDTYAAQFETRTVGDASHQELWVPADRLADLNREIRGEIVPERAFFGPDFRGNVPSGFGLGGNDAYDQIAIMMATGEDAPFDFTLEISANAPTIFLNYPFWKAAGAQRLRVKETDLFVCLERMRMAWSLSPRPAALINNATIVG